MRTISFQVYQIHELSAQAREKAIEDQREAMMEQEDHEAVYWAKDDCSLLEPSHEELVKCFGEDYSSKLKSEFLIKNHRKGIIWHGDVGGTNDGVSLAQNSLEITDSRMFLLWLGIPERFVDRYSYELFSHGIELEYLGEGFGDNPADAAFEQIARNAEAKWQDHLDTISCRIADGVEEYFSDENVIARIEEKGYEYFENGNLYKK
jgi:hypothetical protein